jgi:hypothetical protein
MKYGLLALLLGIALAGLSTLVLAPVEPVRAAPGHDDAPGTQRVIVNNEIVSTNSIEQARASSGSERTILFDDQPSQFRAVYGPERQAPVETQSILSGPERTSMEAPSALRYSSQPSLVYIPPPGKGEPVIQVVTELPQGR